MKEHHWSYKKNDEYFWTYDICDTKEEALKEGRIWAKQEGIKEFVVQELETVPIPTELDIEDIFYYLDTKYDEQCGDDGSRYIFYDTMEEKNNEHLKKLNGKIKEAIEEYIKAVGIKSNWFSVIDEYLVFTED